jgi:uncharacterized membrane protein
MHPVLRVVLAVVGVVFGANLAGDSPQLFAAVVGGLAGLAVGEIIFLRNSLTRLHAELGDIREGLTQPRAGETVRAQTAQRVPEVSPYAPPPVVSPPPPPTRPVAEAAARTESARPAPPAPSEWTPRDSWTPSAPPRENPVIQFLREYFTGGNTLVRAGVVVLFFGVAFLLRYLAEHSHLPMELRLSAVAFGALVLLVLGWRLRTKRPGYALALQGGAIGILYLTVFSALRLYSLLTPTTAFALLAALSALSAALAVLQGSMAVALLGVTGGFLAPFLASTGAGNHVALFSYFVVLNAAIVGIAWFRTWRLLNLAGFAFTFVLSTVWGVLQYRPQDFASTEPFLVVFFLFYVAIAVLYSTRQAPTLHGYIDGTIIFGTPIAAFGLQAAMLHDQRMALAYSALAVSALYIALAWLLHRRRGDLQRLLVEAFTALGVAFLTLAVPLALNGRWSAASWALEGAALIWVGCRQNRRLPRACGTLLQVAAGAALALTVSSGGSVPAGTYIAGLMVGIASVYAAQVMHANKAQLAEYEWSFPGLLFLWGVLWWCIGGLSELEQHIDKSYALSSALVFASITALLSSEFGRRFRMQIALLPAFALLPVMVGFALVATASLHHPLAQGGWIAWPLAFVAFYLIARRQDEALVEGATNTLHAVAAWLLAGLVSWELSWAITQAVGTTGAWSVIAWAIVPAGMLAALPYAVAHIRWPVRAHRTAYLLVASGGLALYLALWSLETNWQVSSPSAPLAYFPLVNPLDVVQGLVLFVLIRFWMRLRSEADRSWESLDQRPVLIALALLGFIWLNAVLLRTIHQWAGIPYELSAMMHSMLVQSSLSIFWAFLALTTMLIATRVRFRMLWLTGAALLVAVVLKLFLVDLSSIGTIERIVSFVGVGLLMLVLGYFSPLPPAAEEAR